MKCKRCKKEIPEESRFCCYCGIPQREEEMYFRPDGLYEKIITIGEKPVAFRAKSEKEVARKIAEYSGYQEEDPIFSAVCEEWQDSHFESIERNTMIGYTKPLKRAIDRFGEDLIKTITSNDISSYLLWLSSEGYALKTIKNHLSVLNLIFKFATVQGYVSSNPAQHVQAPKSLERHNRDMPSNKQIELVKKNYSLPFGLVAYMLLYTGCRWGEIIPLTYGDIDRENKVIHITKSAYPESSDLYSENSKALSRKRDILLLDILANKIPNGKPDELIFRGKSGVMSVSEFHGIWNAYCKEIGEYENRSITDSNGYTYEKIVPKISPHQLRYGFATILFEAGIDEKDAQELLGHSSIQTTRDAYAYIRKNRKEQTVQKLNDYTKNIR